MMIFKENGNDMMFEFYGDLIEPIVLELSGMVTMT